MNNTFTAQEVVAMRRDQLENSEASPILFTDQTFSKRFDHTKATARRHFVDGGNGDKWVVEAADAKNGCMIARNETQKFLVLFTWQS